MLFTFAFISLIPFLVFASEDNKYFEDIHNSVQSLKTKGRYYLEEKACYPDIGCFTVNGLMKHVGMLPSKPEEINTKFFVYTADKDTPRELAPHQPKTFELIDAKKPLVIIIHGFGNDANNTELLKIKEALMNTSKPDVIMVDWKKGAAQPWYTEAALNTEVVGRQVAFLVETLRTQHKVNPNNVHLIGFSLGAQVSGFAGKFSQSQYKWKFGRISALDSAAPLFEGYHGSYLDHNDAQFVDALHTSAGKNIVGGEVGFIEPIGHVDFFPHNGTSQPRCEGQLFHIACNHYSSVIYYAESITCNCQCTAYKCQNWAEFSAKKCTTGGDSRLGYYSYTKSGRGVHYSEMNKEPPFCLN